MFQPSSQGDKYVEHRRLVEESHGAGFCSADHSDQQDSHRVQVGDRRRHDDEDVHVSGAVFQRLVGLNVEVLASHKLRK